MLVDHFTQPWRTARSFRLRPGDVHAWHLYLVLSGSAAISYLFLPVGSLSQALVFMAVEIAAVGVVGATALRAANRADRSVWGLLAAGQGLSLAGFFTWYFLPVAVGSVSAFPSWSDALFLTAIGVGIVAIILIIAKRGRGQGWAPAIDTLVITAALAGLSWIYLIEPTLRGAAESGLVKAVSLAYPLTDLVLLALLVRLVASARRLPAAWLIVAYGASQLAGDTAFNSATVGGSFQYGAPYFFGWLASFVLIGTAALHPSSRALWSSEASPRSLSVRRMVLLAGALVAAPGAMLLAGVRDKIDFYVFAGVTACIFLLVFARMAGVVARLGKAETLSRHRSLHDQLTRLPNRALVFDRTSHALSARTRHGDPVSLLMIDLDEFKQVNDGFGHEAGDHLLQHVATTLQRCIRPGDTAARWGGDEFCVLLQGAGAAAVTVARRIMDDLIVPVYQDGKEVTTGVTVGIATCDDASISADELFRNADEALYAAKRAGKRRYQLFEPSMLGAARQALELRLDLERAITAEEFDVRFQPMVSLESGAVVEVEALVRWNHPSRGLLPPSEFVGIAEETGLIVRIGEFVMRKACAQVVEWQTHYPSATALDLSVNVSPRQLVEPGFRDLIMAILKDTGMDPSHLVCEVTERAMVDQSTDALSVLSSLRAHGIRVAIDDFGTGYSSLRYLTELPADVVKIDSSFVRKVSVDEERAFVLAIMRVIETIGLETVAEGIETREQADYMQAMGCDRGQGYYFARPMKSSALGQLLLEGQTFRYGEAGLGSRRAEPARRLHPGRGAGWQSLSGALQLARLRDAV